MLQTIKAHLRDNEGSEYIEKLILILISFIVGGMLLNVMSSAFNEELQGSLKDTIQDIFSW